MSFHKVYNSVRVAKHHPEFRGYGVAPLPLTHAMVAGWPRNCACPSHLAIVGEGPGGDEDGASRMTDDGLGVPFVGRSGEELDRFLDSYSIDPDSTFITNIGRIARIGNPDPEPDEVATFEPLLQEELNAARPYWIAAVGRIATRYFLGDVDMETVHGIPYLVTIPWLDNGRGGRCVVVSVYHPAAGFHNTEVQALIAYDFAQLAATIEGRIAPRDPDRHDRYPNPEYIDVTNSAVDLGRVRLALSGGTRQEPLTVAIDTEGLPGNPWGLSFCTEAGKAWVIRKVHKLAMRIFFEALIEGIRAGRLHVVLHNSLHDLMVLRELDIPIPEDSFTDTMVLAYHLCIESQGLKSLAYRHAGMVMESYDEVIQEAQDKIAVEYYELIESLVRDGVVYRVPESEYWEFGITTDGEKHRIGYPTKVEAEYGKLQCKEQKLKPTAIKRVVVPPSDPIAVGPFRYIEPYIIVERNKETGEPVTRTKQPQQIHTRVAKALKELREGKITAAQLRKRWEQTDELVVQVVEEVIGEMREASLDDVQPLSRSIHYAARDADATFRIYPILKERHDAMNLTYTGQIDHAIIPMVDRMQETGIQVNLDYFRWLSSDLERRMNELQQRMKSEFGVWINPNSGDQVAELLFDGYGLEPTKMTKGTVDKETGEIKKRRGSTQDKVLEGMRKAHPIIPMILEFRGLSKAKTSFVDVAIRKATRHADGKWYVHCKFRITRVSSGRMSATGPNLMAVMGGDLGIEIRTGYEAGDGYEFAEWDLNQIEMRVMASESGDEFLISMINNDEDIHAGTADKMFNLHLSRPYRKNMVNKSQRDPAKRTGFGVITGIQAPGLVDQMRLQGIIVSEEEAAGWITTWLAACPRVTEYFHTCYREARSRGFVRDWAGRIRYLPGIHSPFKHVRAEAGRQSHSHKIQAGAQSIMKIAMATIWREVIPYWRSLGKYIEPILQIHDALMLRIKGFSKEEKKELDAQVRAAMFAAAPPGFKVPLDAGYVSAETWGQMEH